MSRLDSLPSHHDLVFRSRPNWTAVGFFAGLGCLHLLIAVPAFVAGRWEGYLSLVFALVFITASGVATRFRFELGLLCSSKRLRLRTGIGRMSFEQVVSFSLIQAVRLTLADDNCPAEARIELLCPCNDVECPPTENPRQQALCLAMLLGVPLIKVEKERLSESKPSVAPQPHHQATPERQP